MPKQKKQPATNDVSVSLMGFNHRAIAAERRKIAEACPLVIELRREPLNAHDENAIAVHVLEKPWKGMHIGYVPRALAAMFALKLDRGEMRIEQAWLEEVDPEDGEGSMLLKVIKCKPGS